MCFTGKYIDKHRKRLCLMEDTKNIDYIIECLLGTRQGNN